MVDDFPMLPGRSGEDRRRWRVLALAALGVVYGDIGTSPLYRQILGRHADDQSAGECELDLAR